MDKPHDSLKNFKYYYEQHQKPKKIYNLDAIVRRGNHPVISGVGVSLRRIFSKVNRRIGK